MHKMMSQIKTLKVWYTIFLDTDYVEKENPHKHAHFVGHKIFLKNNNNKNNIN